MYYSPDLSLREYHRRPRAGIVLQRAEEYLKLCDLYRVRVEDIAAHCAVSPGTLTRRLHECDLTPWQMIDAERIRRMGQLLDSRGMDVAGDELADAVGYAERDSFYRSFKRWFGIRFTDAKVQGIAPWRALA